MALACCWLAGRGEQATARQQGPADSSAAHEARAGSLAAATPGRTHGSACGDDVLAAGVQACASCSRRAAAAEAHTAAAEARMAMVLGSPPQ